MTLPQIDTLLKMRRGNLRSADIVINRSTNRDRVAGAHLDRAALIDDIARLESMRSELVSSKI